MAKKRYINTKFWDDNYISELNSTEKLLFIYFITNSLTDICGIYEIPIKRISFDTNIDNENIKKILNKFSKDDKIYYIDGWIYIKNFSKHQLDNPSIEKGRERSISLVPSHIIDKIDKIGQSGDSLGIDCDLPKPKPIPIPKPIYRSSKMTDTDFDSFWSAYPRKLNKKKAKDKFLKLPKDILPSLLKALEVQKGSEQWSKKEFIPHPTTWLNGNRWEDEIDTEIDYAKKAKEYIDKYPNYAYFQFKKDYGKDIADEYIKILL